MTMPIALGLVDPDGAELKLISADASPAELSAGVFALEGERRTLEFAGVARRPALSFLRGFSAPARVDDDLGESDLMTLLKHDRDSFNRWQALQTLATRLLLRSVAAIRSARPPTVEPAFVDAYGSVVADALAGRIDPAFAALALVPPSEADIAREMAVNVDPDAIYRARENLRGALGRAHAAKLTALYEAMADLVPYSPDAAGAGRRALRNGALAAFVAGDAVQGDARAQRQFAEADNMTARLGALAAIATIPGEARERAFAAFARRFAGEPLVLDKWFALQAQIPERGTLERVRGLMSHHAFSLSNPNRARALIGGFTANATQFNRADGAGFDLLCEVVLRLDPTNPQVAARLLAALRSWRSLEAVRQAKAEAVLRRIADQPDLSTDVRDIATRALG
jgi:aminopeptidase N